MGCGVPKAKPATMKAAISTTLMAVETFWNVLLWRMPLRLTNDTIQTSARPSSSGGEPGKTPSK